MTEKNTKKGVWGWIDRIQGDKVILMIVILLILYSCVTIFSSTTMLANSTTSRLDIFRDQFRIVLLGAAIIGICYMMPKIGIFQFLSQFGFLVCAVMLSMLVLNIGTVEANDAVRALQVGSLQLNVYEFTKVGMVLYLSWAVQAYKKNELFLLNLLARRLPQVKFLKTNICKKLVYIYFPIMFVAICTLKGSFSSTCFVVLIMTLTILIGGIPFKDVGILAMVVIIAVASSYGIYRISGRTVFEGRWSTVEGRIQRWLHPEAAEEIQKGTKEWNKYIDSIRQPEGAKIAIKEGGLFGKGPGKSTQKYAVSLIFSDYMFSFIVEEYGFVFGALVMIILYVSLLARGSIIVRYCDNDYGKTAVAGLILLISGQAMMHMYINVGLGPLTGQTLPMISHGSSSFLAFSIAFGVILSISKLAKKKVDKAAKNAPPIIVPSDDIKAGLDDLDQFDSENI